MPLVEKIITFPYYYSWEWALLLQLPREVSWGCCRFVLCTVMSAGQCSFLSLTLPLSLEITPSRVPKASPNPRKEHNCWAEGEKRSGGRVLTVIYNKVPQERSQPMNQNEFVGSFRKPVSALPGPKDYWRFPQDIFPSFWISLEHFSLSNWEFKIVV